MKEKERKNENLNIIFILLCFKFWCLIWAWNNSFLPNKLFKIIISTEIFSRVLFFLKDWRDVDIMTCCESNSTVSRRKPWKNIFQTKIELSTHLTKRVFLSENLDLFDSISDSLLKKWKMKRSWNLGLFLVYKVLLKIKNYSTFHLL